jgi:hypothetical protein
LDDGSYDSADDISFSGIITAVNSDCTIASNAKNVRQKELLEVRQFNIIIMLVCWELLVYR